MGLIKQFKNKDNVVVRASLGWSDNVPEVPMWELTAHPDLRKRLSAPLPVVRIPPPPLLDLGLPYSAKLEQLKLAWGAAGKFHNDIRMTRSKMPPANREESVTTAMRILIHRRVDLWTWCAYAQANTYGKYPPTMLRWLTPGAVHEHLETVLPLRPPVFGWVLPVPGHERLGKLRRQVFDAVASSAHLGLSTSLEAADKIITEADFNLELEKLSWAASKSLQHYDTQLKRGEWIWPKHTSYGLRE